MKINSEKNAFRATNSARNFGLKKPCCPASTPVYEFVSARTVVCSVLGTSLHLACESIESTCPEVCEIASKKQNW